MEIVNFSDIYDTFMKNLKRKMIIPIIGSGFTLNSEAKNGKVPSGKDYQEHMIDSLCNKFEELKDSKEKMYNEPFSQMLNYISSRLMILTKGITLFPILPM